MKKNAKRKSTGPELVVDIKGVKPDTRIGDLTVDQFVKLAFQLSPQLANIRWRDRLADTERVVNEMRSSFSSAADRERGAIAKGVREAQLAILDEMPQLIKRAAAVTARARDTGLRQKRKP